MRSRVFLFFTLLAPAALTGCGSDGDERGADPVATTKVAVVDNDFEPAAVTVGVGATVTWTWKGSSRHDVVGDGFKSEVRKSGSFEHAFDAAGTYDYVCNVHSGMRGRVVVA